MLSIKGLGTALVTPFMAGRVDFEAYRSMVRRQVDAGVDFLVPLGSTAETPCLSADERVKLLKIAVEEADGIPVVVGAGSNSLVSTIENIRLFEPCSADAYLIVAPFYNKPTQEGLYEYFKAVADSTEKPIVLYNVPSRTGVNMNVDTILKLASVPNIVAIKEASGNLSQIIDDQTLALMACGADGVISVASNIVPKLMKELVEAVSDSNLKKAISVNNRLVPLYHACFAESNPIPVKAALASMGLCSAEMRLPLTEAENSTKTLLHNVLRELGMEIYHYGRYRKGTFSSDMFRFGIRQNPCC